MDERCEKQANVYGLVGGQDRNKVGTTTCRSYIVKVRR